MSTRMLGTAEEMKIRKQSYDLTPEDIQAYPIWEFALDEVREENQDEATVRPLPTTDSVDPSEGMYVLRAHFTFGDGTSCIGYLTPSKDHSDIATIQPHIITEKGQVGFWFGLSKPDLSDLYSTLEKKPDKVFPVRFTCEIKCLGDTISGTIPAFLKYGNIFTRKIKELI
jgi:hypothetical protein